MSDYGAKDLTKTELLNSIKYAEHVAEYADSNDSYIMAIDSPSISYIKESENVLLSELESIPETAGFLNRKFRFSFLAVPGENCVEIDDEDFDEKMKKTPYFSTFSFYKPDSGMVKYIRKNFSRCMMPGMYVVEWTDGNGYRVIYPIKQIMKDGKATVMVLRYKGGWMELEGNSWSFQHAINRILDIASCWFIHVNKNGRDVFVPVAPGTVKKAFRTRDKEDGERRKHVVHMVNDFQKKNGTDVEAHLRGTGIINMDGQQYEIYVGVASQLKMPKQTLKAYKEWRNNNA